jgi:hypothetical protein
MHTESLRDLGEGVQGRPDLGILVAIGTPHARRYGVDYQKAGVGEKLKVSGEPLHVPAYVERPASVLAGNAK